jgi:hypothetical protein
MQKALAAMDTGISDFIITPPTKYVKGRHAGLEPASSIFLHSRLRTLIT